MNYEPKLDTHAAGFVWIESSLFTAENREVLVGLQTGSPFLIGQYKTCFWCEWWVWAVGARWVYVVRHTAGRSLLFRVHDIHPPHLQLAALPTLAPARPLNDALFRRENKTMLAQIIPAAPL